MQLIFHAKETLLTRQYRLLVRDAVQIFHKHKLHDAPVTDFVGYLSGYEFQLTDRNCGGFCNGWNKIIALRDYSVPADSVTCFADLPIDTKLWERLTLLHELGHSLQFKNAEVELERTLSTYLRMEHQAETLAYQMYRGMYGPINPDYFGSYQTKEQKIFLRDWYGDYLQNDLNI